MADTTPLPGTTASDVPDGADDAAARALILRVGERVRRAREGLGIPRRVLSQMSGVSPRYLALLEAGDGNISIGLLYRVAAALDTRIDRLVGDDEPEMAEAQQIAAWFRAAPPDVRARVRDLLGQGAPSQRARRVGLIGLRGAGKSTLGTLAAAALGIPFVELNREIADQAGMPVTEVMALYGQEGYRRLEAQALDRVVAAHDTLILAAGGGIVAEPETYRRLQDWFHTVWVRATPEEHMARVRAQGDTRPMAGNPEAMDQLRHILTSREALYDQALARLDTGGRNVDQSLADLLALIAMRGFLD